MGDELYFKVAFASVDDKVQLEHNAPSTIHIPAGTRLDIRFEYQLEETSDDEDLWTFRLDVQIPGKENSTAQRQHHDRALFSDDTVCHVGIDIDFTVPGKYDLSYTALVDLSRRKWNKGHEFETVASDEYKGTLAIVVDEPES